MGSEKRQLRQNLNEAISRLIPTRGWESSVPIVAAVEEKELLFQLGTGTLLRVADKSFIVTAAHVAIELCDYDRGMCLPGSNDSFVQIHGTWKMNEKHDVAILPLDIGAVEKLTGYTFLRLDDVSFEEDLSKGIFVLFGYPGKLTQACTRTDTELHVKPFQYTTFGYEGKTDSFVGYDEICHLLLNAEPSDITDITGQPFEFLDLHGKVALFPKDLGGISGCSVWRIGRQDKPVTTWGEEPPKVVAVQTGVYSGAKVIRSTRWGVVLGLLHAAFPELRPAIELSSFYTL